MPFSWPVPLTRSSLLAAAEQQPSLVWLLELTWAGRVWRWSSRPVDVTTRAGDALPFDGGLDEVDASRSLAVLSDSPDLLSVSLDLLFPVDVAAWVAAGHDLSTATGELSLWVDGSDYEDRVVLLQGKASRPHYSYEGRPVSLSLVEEPYDDTALWPPSTARVSETTWATPHPDDVGKPYPTVFGTPGYYEMEPGVGGGGFPGSPALRVEWDGTDNATLLISDGDVFGGSVYLFYDGARTIGPLTPARVEDRLGRWVSIIDISGLGIAVTRATSYYITWPGGGIREDDGRACIDGAGSLLLWLMDRSSLRVDRGRFAAARRPLNAFRVSGYVDEQVSPWQWAADNLLAILPVSIHSGPGGIYPIVWRHTALREQAVEHIIAGPGVELQGEVRYLQAPHEYISEVEVAWGLDAELRTYRRLSTFTPDRAAGDADHHSSAMARTSAQRASGPGRSQRIESDIIYSAVTAAKVARWKLAADGFSTREVTYSVGQEMAWLEMGDVVLLTDDGLSFDGEVALVTGQRLTDTGTMLLDLQLVVAVDRERRTTGPDKVPPTYDDTGDT